MSDGLLFLVSDAVEIAGRGIMLVGELTEGSVSVGDEVAFTGPDGAMRTARVAGIEHLRKRVESVSASEAPAGPFSSPSLLLEGLGKGDVPRGTSLRAPCASFAPTGDSSAPAIASAPASWMTDPTGRHEHRYWDGSAWTEHVSDGGVAGSDPLATAPVRSAPASAPDASASAEHLERMRALVRARLAKDGPAAFAQLKLDVDPLFIPEQIVLLTGKMERAWTQTMRFEHLWRRAALYEAIGMSTEADRDRLLWAAMKEGHTGLSRTSKVWARGLFGLEFGSTFAASYDLLTKGEGKKVRVPLMQSGRAVAYGYCTRCGRVERLDERLHCGRGHAQVEDVACVVPQDAEAVRAALETVHSG